MPAAVVQADPIAFEKLGLDPALALGVQDRGFDAATPIQAAVFPIVSAGRDMIASAETGSGNRLRRLVEGMNTGMELGSCWNRLAWWRLLASS